MSECRMYRVTIDKDRPVMAWADVKITPKQRRIIRSSGRAAWSYQTVVTERDGELSETAAWERFVRESRERIRDAEIDIVRNREWLAVAGGASG